MAITGPWTDPKIFVGPFDMTGFSNNAALTYSADMLDATVFGDTTRVNTAGLRDVKLDVAGLVDLADDGADERLFDNIGLSNVPVTLMFTNTPAEGDSCHLFQAAQADYKIVGTHGQMFKWSCNINAALGYPLPTGTVLETAGAAKTTSSNSTGTQAGAVTASQYLYASLHVIAIDTGTTLDVEIESDDNSGFTSATTQLSFTQVTTALNSEFATRVAGAITDDWWRVKWTIVGTSYTFAVAMGIGS